MAKTKCNEYFSVDLDKLCLKPAIVHSAFVVCSSQKGHRGPCGLSNPWITWAYVRKLLRQINRLKKMVGVSR